VGPERSQATRSTRAVALFQEDEEPVEGVDEGVLGAGLAAASLFFSAGLSALPPLSELLLPLSELLLLLSLFLPDDEL
jgi:hypothetical protein